MFAPQRKHIVRFLMTVLAAAATADDSSSGDSLSAVPGSDVILSCPRLSDITDIIGVMVTRPDLPAGEYVLFIRDNRSDTTNQNAAFRGRVERGHGWTLNIKNVSLNDSGTYTCQGLRPGGVVGDTCSTNLTVKGGGGPTSGGDIRNKGQIITATYWTPILFLLLFVFFVIKCVKKRGKNKIHVSIIVSKIVSIVKCQRQRRQNSPYDKDDSVL